MCHIVKGTRTIVVKIILQDIYAFEKVFIILYN